MAKPKISVTVSDDLTIVIELSEETAGGGKPKKKVYVATVTNPYEIQAGGSMTTMR